MSKTEFALEPGGPKRLEVSYTGNWKDFTIRLDGKVVGTVADYQELKAGQEFVLEDGSILKVRFRFPLLRLHKDGRPLLFYDADKMLKFDYGAVFFLAAANFTNGLNGMLFHKPIENLPPAGLESVIVGCVFLLLGFFIMRKSAIALAVSIVIYVLSSISSFIVYDISKSDFVIYDISGVAMIVGIIVRLFLLFMLIQGFDAIKAFKGTRLDNSIS
jgi:hypothetical protein